MNNTAEKIVSLDAARQEKKLADLFDEVAQKAQADAI